MSLKQSKNLHFLPVEGKGTAPPLPRLGQGGAHQEPQLSFMGKYKEKVPQALDEALKTDYDYLSPLKSKQRK